MTDFSERMEKIGQELADDVKRAFSGIDMLDALSDKDWAEIHRNLDLQIYIENYKGKTVIDVSFGEQEEDNRSFDLEEAVNFLCYGYEAPRAFFEKIADDFEECAKKIRQAKHAY